MRVFASVHVYVCVEHLIDGKFNSCIRPINAIKAHLLWRHSRKKNSLKAKLWHRKAKQKKDQEKGMEERRMNSPVVYCQQQKKKKEEG